MPALSGMVYLLCFALTPILHHHARHYHNLESLTSIPPFNTIGIQLLLAGQSHKETKPRHNVDILCLLG
jgi:hypothetical protein